MVKTNSSSFVLIQPIQLPPGATGVLVIIVDETRDSTRVVLPEGAALGQPRVRYEPLS